MRKLSFLLLTLLYLSGFNAWGQDRGVAGGGHEASAAPAGRSVTSRPASVSRAPVVINMSHGSSGGQNRNYPSQQPGGSSSARTQPSYGQLHWNNQGTGQRTTRPILQTNVQQGVVGQGFQRPRTQNYSQPGVRAAVSIHHHPYTQGYVRKKLQKMGVSAEPNLITDRAEMVNTDRTHSVIRFPQHGPDHQAITAAVVSVRDYNNSVVRNQMMIADSPEWQARADQYNAAENQAGHYYWHNDEGVNYCHYLDGSGYNWYGWYTGDQYFWTRNFNGRWWWYDSDYDRWCFWNNGFWWWQDPYHVGDLYCYNDDNYIPCNSAEDQVVVTASNNANLQSNVSPDGTRIVKVDADTQDAFLYDTANPPTFDPVYLASGVQSVQFSDTSNGRPLEIILRLNDGSFDLFDGQGNAYGPGTFDADQAAQAAGQPDSSSVPAGDQGNNPPAPSADQTNNPPPAPSDNPGTGN
ncbi:MAG TPA: hypothetical protein VN963_06120 [bacterium]|nr:hypothetical protein [bacterium]